MSERMGQPLFTIARNIVVTSALPVSPSDGENARRQVRHGLADVLEWLGLKVGPKPGAEIHFYEGQTSWVGSGSGTPVIYSSLWGLSKLKELEDLLVPIPDATNPKDHA